MALLWALAAVWFYRLFRSAAPEPAGGIAAFGLINAVMVLVNSARTPASSSSRQSRNLLIKVVGGAFGTIIAPILVFYLIRYLEKKEEPKPTPVVAPAPAPAPEPTPAPKKSPWLWIILGVALAGIVGGGVVFFVVKSMKEDDEEKPKKKKKKIRSEGANGDGGGGGKATKKVKQDVELDDD